MPLEFEQLIKLNAARIRRISRQYADDHEVDDLFQEISMALWRGIDSFRGDSSVETWLYRVALNTAMTSVRKSVRRRKKVELFRVTMPREETGPEGYSQADVLEKFLESLGEIDASILMMYLDGLSAEEMELVLGIKSNAIAVRINRIKQKFSSTFVE